MLKNHFALYGFLGLALVLFACQTNVQKTEKEKMVFINYYSRYLQNDRLFRAEADFFIGDSIQNAQAVEMAAVSFQGGSMELKSLPNRASRYKTERRGNFQSHLQFKYEDSQGKDHTTDFQLDPIESFLFKGDISQSKGFTLVWKGLPLAAGESLLLLFADQTNKAGSTEIKGPTSRSESHFSGDFLKDLETGSGVLLIVRSKKGVKKEALQIINYELSYYSAPQDINIDK